MAERGKLQPSELVKPDDEIVSVLDEYFKSEEWMNKSCQSCQFPEFVPGEDCGLMIGNLKFMEFGNPIDCSLPGGTLIPSCINKVTNITSDALFILVVENWSSYVDLEHNKFFKRIPCIVITSNGQPLDTTALFLRKLKIELNLPIFALTNCDVDGIKMLLAYRYGSKEKRLPYLDVRWLGLRPSDLEKYQIPFQCGIPLSKQDVDAARKMLVEFPLINEKKLKSELEQMLDLGLKFEMDALCTFRFNYVTNVYLPLKLQEHDWI